MFQDRVVLLTNPEDVEGFLAKYPNSMIFKAGTCHKTMQGFGYVQEQLENREDLMVGVIRVVEARAASNLVAEKTGVKHESPQVLLFKDNQIVFDKDNWDITPTALEEGLKHIPTTNSVVSSNGAAKSDLGVYKQLIEQYLNNTIDDRQFEYAYTTTFRDDSSLRSNEEVEILGSIFGDVDRHMEMHMMMAGKSNYEIIRERAAAAYKRLEAFN